MKLTGEIYYVNLLLFGRFNIQMSDEDWEYMCRNRWFSENPSLDEIEAEFGICGLRDEESDEEANKIVRDTVAALREISGMDLEMDCRRAVNYGVYASAMDRQPPPCSCRNDILRMKRRCFQIWKTPSFTRKRI